MSWDHTVNDPETVGNLRLGIISAFQDRLSEIQLVAVETMPRWKIILRRLAAWFIWACLMAGAFAVSSLWYW